MDESPDAAALLAALATDPDDPAEVVTLPGCEYGRKRSSQRMAAIRPVCTRCGVVGVELAVDAGRIVCAYGCAGGD